MCHLLFLKRPYCLSLSLPSPQHIGDVTLEMRDPRGAAHAILNVLYAVANGA